MWYSMVVGIACNSSGDGFAGSTKRGTNLPAAFTLARALGCYRLPRKGVDRVANKVDLHVSGRRSWLSENSRHRHERSRFRKAERPAQKSQLRSQIDSQARRGKGESQESSAPRRR